MKLTQLPNGNWIDKTRITHLQIQAPTTFPSGRTTKDQVGIWLHEGTEWIEFDSKQAAAEFRDRLAAEVNGVVEERPNTGPTADPEALAHECVQAIEDDLMKRPSLRSAYMSLNGSVCSEIMATWSTIIEGKLRSL